MISEEAIQSLKALLGERQVITDPVELLVYEVDAAQDRGMPDAVVFPRSAEDACEIVRWAAENGTPLISRGAGTGLSGGAVADKGGVIVQFSRMDRFLELDVNGRSAVIEPGVVNQELEELAKSRGLYYPPDPSSGRAATMGGNVAENAGGPHCFKYGVTTNYITGLEFVLADGSLVRCGGLAYDYPEYDLCSLLTGSEGTLGILTQISLRLLRNPPGIKTLMAVFDSVEQAGMAVSAVIASGLVPACMEMMDQKIAQIVEDYAHPGIPTDAGSILIVEVDGYPSSLDSQTDEIAHLLIKHGGRNLRFAHSAEERDRLWFARKSAAGAMARLAPAFLLLDGTVPRSQLSRALEATNRICDHAGLRVGYVLHAGDGNLHPFILMYPDDAEQVACVHKAGREFMEEVTRLNGSITGEHGVGIEKRPYLSLMYEPIELSIMLDVKHAFDPRGLFNPGKIFPPVEAAPTRPVSSIDVPSTVFTPASVEEASQGLSILSRTRIPVRITGGAAQELHSYPQPTLVVSTRELAGIHEYAPQDLYITSGAGTSLVELQAFLASEFRVLPVEAPWPEATLGGLLATNLNAPLRMRYGSIRDQVLAMTIVLADGRTICAGRPVVKNVAGYDLPKLMVGSFGTLGLIADVTFKISARPRILQTLLVPVDDLERGLDWASQALRLALAASAVVLVKDIPMPGIQMPGYPYLFAYTAEGLPEDVATELDQVRLMLKTQGAPHPIEVETLTGSDLWATLLGKAFSGTVKIRSGVAPKNLAPYVLSQVADLVPGSFLVDIASGLVYAAYRPEGVGEAQGWVDGLRKAALAAGGYTVVLEAPDDWQSKLNPWGYRPDALEIMKNLKSRWDPAGILNPGGFTVNQV